jgi:RNA polymerase sigma-70 factor (ECF subfamily)
VIVSAAVSRPAESSSDSATDPTGQTGEGSDRRPSDPQAHPLDFDQIYNLWFHEVSRWVRAFGGLDADLDDLVQEVFLVVRRKLDGFDGVNLPGWLYRIAQRTVSDYRRRAWFRRLFHLRREVIEDIVDTAPNPEHHAERRDAARLLAQLLAKLSPARRAAFILFEIEGYSGEEIARLESIPVKTVYTRLHYARKDFLRLVSQASAADAALAQHPRRRDAERTRAKQKREAE